MHTVLAARSDFSIGESILSVEELIDESKKAGATVIGLTDTMSVTGLIDFTTRCVKAEVKPIVGCRLRLVDDHNWRKPKGEKSKLPPEWFVTYYVRSEKGLVALFRLLSLANDEAHFYYTAKLSISDLADTLTTLTGDDVVIASGDTNSLVAHPNAEVLFVNMGGLIGRENVYMTLTPIDTPYFDRMNAETIKIAEMRGLPVIATRPVLYENGGADAADIKNAVSRNIRMSDLWIQGPAMRNLHPLDQRGFIAEVVGAGKRHIERYNPTPMPHFRAAIKNTDEFVSKFTYVWSKAAISMPVMAPDEYTALVKACKVGWGERMTKATFGHQPSPADLVSEYLPRLKYELGVLKKLGFSGYFLLVKDIVDYAKTNGILVGPGRGSVGGSLVAYLVGITDCDPIRFGLLFERFINPDRIDLPDADLDFMSERRHEIIDYLIGKYGEKRVAGISNFSTLAAASAIRNVGKALGLSEDDYRCSKFTPKAHGANIPLPKAADMVSEIGAFRDRFIGPPGELGAWDVMVRLEGTMTNYGRHAAGIVVGGRDLTDFGVVERRKDGATMNWDKEIIETAGLVKVDILGLSTLDLIDLTLKYIGKRHGKHLNLLRVPLDDPKVLAQFAAGKTTGVFQFASGGMRRLLKELGKDGVITFDDITAATALYRPGPMESGMMDSFWKRKQGLEMVEYDHDLLIPILEPTYGVFVYQEQVMKASIAIAGYSGPDSDKLRKIMGKKKPEDMAKERPKFIQGCIDTVACSADWAGDLFDKIEGFAGYGFNKSHSVEYTLISYEVMYLKTHYPVEFFAAALSLLKAEELPAILKDAQTAGIEIALPDINMSSGEFEILTDTLLCIPFNRIKGISTNTSNAIVAARKDGPFTSVADLNARVEKRKCHKGHVAILDKIGAFASIDPTLISQRHPDRIKDQRDLIPGLITDTVPVNRGMLKDKYTAARLGEIVIQYREEKKDDGEQIKPMLGKAARFMVISDCPTSQEERFGQMTQGDSFGTTALALAESGLIKADAYWTALIKRPKASKQVSAQEIEAYLPYLRQEIDLLKPPVVVLLGSATVRHFMPDLKGKASDAAGKIIYNKDWDANMIIGFNPGEIFYDPDKQIALNEVFAQVSTLID